MNRIRQLRVVCLELASSTDQFHSMELASSTKNFQVKTGVRTASLAERRAATHPLTLSPRPRVLFWRLLLSSHSLPFSPRPLVLFWRLLLSSPLLFLRACVLLFGRFLLVLLVFLVLVVLVAGDLRDRRLVERAERRAMPTVPILVAKEEGGHS